MFYPVLASNTSDLETPVGVSAPGIGSSCLASLSLIIWSPASSSPSLWTYSFWREIQLGATISISLKLKYCLGAPLLEPYHIMLIYRYASLGTDGTQLRAPYLIQLMNYLHIKLLTRGAGFHPNLLKSESYTVRQLIFFKSTSIPFGLWLIWKNALYKIPLYLRFSDCSVWRFGI